MGWLVKNIFAFATYFSAVIFHPHMWVCVCTVGEGVSSDMFAAQRKTEKWLQNMDDLDCHQSIEMFGWA